VLANEIQPRTRGSWKDGPARLRCAAEGGEKGKRLILRKIKVRNFDNPTMSQANDKPDWPQWKSAITEELQQMEDENVFE